MLPVTIRLVHRNLRVVRPFARLRLSTGQQVSEEIQKRDAQEGESRAATETGVIQKSDEETLIYFDNVYPRATSFWRPTQWYNILLTNQTREAVRNKIMNYASPEDNPIRNLELRSTIPIKRDGGVFATFLVPAEYTKAQVNAMIQQNTVRESSKSITSFFTKAAAFPVKGAPWIEDLRRLPNTVIRVKYDGDLLTEEELYSLFRRYGSIIDIYPGEGNSKMAKIKYRSFRGAICAKNCVSGMNVKNTTLHVMYEPIIRAHVIRDSFLNHPRIAIPLLIALLSILAVMVFDPIREFCIEQKITQVYSLSMNNYFFQRLLSFTSSTVSSVKQFWGLDEDKLEKKKLWSERIDKIDDLKMWLEENNNTFVIVTGPRGSGKHELVMEHTLINRSRVLYLDCDTLIKSRTDTKFLRNAAQQLGYFPVFTWLNSLTGLLDLGVQGLTGQKSGLSESKETQFRNMLNTAMMSIRRIALKNYSPTMSTIDDPVGIKEEDYLQQHPENKPVIVIDRFSNKAEMNGFVYKEIADWASLLVQMNVAHVIFLTESVAPNQLLAEALPNQVFKFMFLSDASKDSARNYVLSHLHTESQRAAFRRDDENQQPLAVSGKFRKEIDYALEPIGGRMQDLQAFVRRVNSGEEPAEALEKMVEQASEQITQMFLSEKTDPIRAAQAWELINMLAEKDVVKFSDIVFKPLFKSSPEAGVLDLEKNGLITINRNRGVLREVRPAKPLFRAAFSYLSTNKELFKILKTGYLLRVISFENQKIKKFEQELESLGSVNDKMFKSRLDYLSSKISTSSAVINDCEEQIKFLSKV